MDLQQLTTFRIIATLGSFSQAADVMGYAQSTVSGQIKSLEAELQTRLFSRSGSKRVTLTPAGETLLSYAEKMLNLEDEIKIEVASPKEPHGTLTIRVPESVSTYYLPATVRRFNASFPRVNLNFMNCTYFDLPEELSAGMIDLGFVIEQVYQAPKQTSEAICTIPLALVMGASGSVSEEVPFDFTQMMDRPLIAPSNDCSYLHLVDRLLLEQKIKFPTVWRFNSIEAIKQTLMQGTGFAVLPQAAVQRELAAGYLKALPWRENVLQMASLWMVWQSEKSLPPALKIFMEMVREDLRK
jgi:DNA-binding transcriptional LysR family regulator